MKTYPNKFYQPIGNIFLAVTDNKFIVLNNSFSGQTGIYLCIVIVCSLGKIYSSRCTTNMFIEVFQIVFNQIG